MTSSGIKGVTLYISYLFRTHLDNLLFHSHVPDGDYSSQSLWIINYGKPYDILYDLNDKHCVTKVCN